MQPRRGNAAYEGPRGLYVPQKLHTQFVGLRNHAGADRELYAWYGQVAEEWYTGARKGENPDPDMFVFWKARYAEKWPASPKSAQAMTGPNPEHAIARQRYGSRRFGQ